MGKRFVEYLLCMMFGAAIGWYVSTPWSRTPPGGSEWKEIEKVIKSYPGKWNKNGESINLNGK